MRIFIHVRGSYLDKLYKVTDIRKSNTYKGMILYGLKNGSVSMLGFQPDQLHQTYFISNSNGKPWQLQWCKEHNITYDEDNWEMDILQQQIDYFKPDVLLSFTPVWAAKHPDIFRNIKLKSFWKASPIPALADYSYFRLGLSYHEHYLKMLKSHGAQHTEQHDFSFDPETWKKFRNEDRNKYDITFCGTYASMFEKRNELLVSIARHFGKNYRILYFLKTKMRRNKWYHPLSYIPAVPKELLWYYRKPVFLKDYLKVLYQSKIVFNAHSNIAGKAKGNMRVFETLGMKSFLLTDAGEYPAHFKPGRDFVTYTDQDDLIEKIGYYLNNPTERREIANQGYETLKKHYNVKRGSERLMNIFSKYY